jgi:hypothetical protein
MCSPSFELYTCRHTKVVMATAHLSAAICWKLSTERVQVGNMRLNAKCKRIPFG